MFKNKDGSYNTFQVLIMVFIAIIGISIIVLSIDPDIQIINIDPLYIILGFIISLIISISWRTINIKYRNKSSQIKPTEIPILKSIKPKIIETPKQNIVITNNDTIKYNEKYKSKYVKSTSNYKIPLNLISVIVTCAFTIIIIIIGVNIINTIISAIPQISETSPLSTTQNAVISNLSIAFNIMSLIPVIFGVMIIIGILTQIIRY